MLGQWIGTSLVPRHRPNPFLFARTTIPAFSELHGLWAIASRSHCGNCVVAAPDSAVSRCHCRPMGMPLCYGSVSLSHPSHKHGPWRHSRVAWGKGKAMLEDQLLLSAFVVGRDSGKLPIDSPLQWILTPGSVHRQAPELLLSPRKEWDDKL